MSRIGIKTGRCACAIAWLLVAVAPVPPQAAKPSSPSPQKSAATASKANAHGSARTPNTSSRAKDAPPRIVLKPKLVPGEVIRYQIEFQTTTDTSTGGAIQDPNGPSKLVVTWNAVVRLEVLRKGTVPAKIQSPPPNGTVSGVTPPKVVNIPAVQVRTTYEKSSATVQSDSPDPDAEGIQAQYAKLEGRSIEFMLASDGRVSDVHGLDNFVGEQSAVQIAEKWMQELSGGASLPAAGIVPGQKWTRSQPAPSIPLAGMAWRMDSTYLRNEPCPTGNSEDGTSPTPAVSAGGNSCAMILTELSLVGPRGAGDRTPPDYKRNGLRTAGQWSGSGENVTYISLQSGWVVSVMQTGTEQMNVTITNPAQSNIRYAGQVETRSQVVLIPPQVSASAP